MSFAARATAYARDVVAGRVLACLYVRQACKRHLADLERKRFRYEFSAERADRVCRFIERLPHTKGRWAAKRELTRLEDWQCFIICSVFGWVDRKTSLRRFRVVYIEVPRKNGKSHLSAGVGNYMLCADGEYGAEVYSGATSEKQAWEVFRPARLMAIRMPEFADAFGIEVNAKSLHIPGNGSRFEPVVGKPGDGPSPSMAITDEYHEHDTDDQVETMRTGMGAREQPIQWMITTAGSDIGGPCYRMRQDVIRVLGGSVRDEEMFGIVYTVDEGDEWKSDDALRKANPNYDVSVAGEWLEGQRRAAIHSAHRQAAFLTKHLNIWVNAGAPWMNMEWWNRQADPSLSEDQFEGEACWVGGDLASKIDVASVIKVFRRGDDLYLFGRHYVPESRLQEVERYRGWHLDGHLIATPGDIIDHSMIRDDLLEDAERFRWVQGGFDSYNATQLIGELNEALGRQDAAIAVPQSVAYLSEPMKWLEALTKAGTVHHDGNPVLNWMMSNVTVQVDRNDNIFPRKERADNKIDGVVASVMALGCEMRSEEQLSVYEQRPEFITI